MHHKYFGVFYNFLLLFLASCKDSDLETKTLRNTKYSNEKHSTLEIKYWTLVENSKLGPIFRITSTKEFQYLFVDTPRNYSAILLLASESKYDECREILSTLRSIAHSYQTNFPKKPEIFFIEIRFELTPSIFRKIGLRTMDTPSLYYLSSTAKLKNLKQMDTRLYPYNHHGVVNWIESVTGVSTQHLISAEEPDESYTYIILTILILSTVYKNQEKIMNILETDLRRTSSCIIITILLLCTSGQIYNHIEGVPFAVQGRSGEFIWFHPSGDTQLIIESIVIFSLSVANVIGLINIIENGSKISSKPGNSNSKVWIGLILYGLTFHIMQLMCRQKM